MTWHYSYVSSYTHTYYYRHTPSLYYSTAYIQWHYLVPLSSCFCRLSQFSCTVPNKFLHTTCYAMLLLACWQPSQQLHWLLTTATIGQQLYNIRDHNTSPPPSITTLLLPITNSTNYPYLNSRDGQVLGLEYKFAVNIIIVEKWIPKTTTWSR